MDKIILTDNKYNKTTNGIPFPKTPEPEIRYDGIFLTKQQMIYNINNKLKRR